VIISWERSLLRSKGSAIILLLILFGIFSFSRQAPTECTVSENTVFTHSLSTYENVTTHKENLIINGTQTFVIENCTYIQTGNIDVSGEGRLIIRDARFTVNQSYGRQYSISIREHSHFEMKNVEAFSAWSFPIFLKDSADMEIDSVSSNCSPESWDNSSLNISNSTLYGCLYMRDYAQVLISNSTRISPYVTLDFCPLPPKSISIEGLRPGFLKRWNLYENTSVLDIFNLTVEDSQIDGWETWFTLGTNQVEVKDSVLNSFFLSISNAEVSLNGLKTGFYNSWNLGNVYIVNSSITQNWGFLLWNVNTTFSDCCEVHLHPYGGLNKISVENSTLYTLILENGCNATICSDQTIVNGGVLLSDSNLWLFGNITFNGVASCRVTSSQVIRNYNLVVADINGNPLQDADLTLLDAKNMIVWNGITDSLGQANFNLTFVDSNYTDTLRLYAVRGNLSAATSVTFLSDTPVIVHVHILGDVSSSTPGVCDGRVDMRDISYLVIRFNTKPSSANWNPNADINNDATVNMRDISIAILNFNKHE